MTQVQRIPLRIVFYKEDGDWIAHCLEFDLCGDGATHEEALKSLARAIDIQVEQSVEHDNLRNLFTPADGEYFQMFAEGQDVAVGQMEFKPIKSVVIERTEAREYHGPNKKTASVPA